VHNNAYWKYKDYLGFGTSAHSFVNGKRWWNFSSLKFYNNSVTKNGNAEIGSEVLSEKQKLEEYVMLALRSSGLDIVEFKMLFGNNWLSKNKTLFDDLVRKGFATLSNSILKFTPKGYAICDEILTKLNSL
jgi:oxygen-independent coproporphyrinogen-3 oxidase